jgi:hypothetical protein
VLRVAATGFGFFCSAGTWINADIAAVDQIEPVNGAVEREHQKKFLQIQIRKLSQIRQR